MKTTNTSINTSGMTRKASFLSAARLYLAVFLLLSLGLPSCSLSAETPQGKGGTPHFLSKKLLENYLKISNSLAGDSTKGLDEAAKQLMTVTGSYLKKTPDEDETKQLRESAQLINMHAKLLGSKKTDIKTARQLFAVISDELSLVFSEEYKGADRAEYHIFHCSMAGHYWLQKDRETRNPYFGKRMLGCGSEVKEVSRVSEGEEEEFDPFAVVDAPPSPRAESIMRHLKCACCGKSLLTATCGCAANRRIKVNNRIADMEDQELSDEEIIVRLRDEFGKGVVPEYLEEIGETLSSKPFLRIANAYKVAEEIPRILEKITCFCQCHRMGHKSLLDCYKDEHATKCKMCIDEALLAHSLWKEGKETEEIVNTVHQTYDPKKGKKHEGNKHHH